MAITCTAPPVFLLFDYLLASSWTWLALLLATIATTFRAFRLRFPRHCPFPLAAQASTPAITSLADASTVQPCRAGYSSSCSASLQRRFKRRAGSKSTSALEKLLHKQRGDFWRSGIEFVSSVLDVELPSKFKRIASASKIFHDRHACAEMHLEHGKNMHPSAEKKGMHSVKQVSDYHDRQAPEFRLGSKFQWKTPSPEESEDVCEKASAEDLECTEDCLKWLPSWAQSLCGPSQLRWPSKIPHIGDHVSPLNLASPCFEKQFGWDKLLDSKLGFPWRLAPGTVSDRSMESTNVVRMWDDLPRKLIRMLDLDEVSTLALDPCLQEGLACTGDLAGKISMWELERRACARASVPFAQPVLALSINSEQNTTVVGNASSIGLWDHRSPSCNLNSLSMLSAPISGLKSRESGLCITTDSGILSMYDLRKTCRGPLVSSVVPERRQNLSTSEYECTFWEKFAGVAEEDEELECDFDMVVRAVETHTCGSLMSRLTTFVRAVTFML